MYSFSTLSSRYLGFRQFVVLVGVCLSTLCQGQSTPLRMPASYIPDDDIIVKPVQNELSFYQQYIASDTSRDVVSSRNQLKIWNDNQVFADQYGLDSSLTGSAYFVPTPEEKWEYFKEKYMRYLRRKGEEPLKNMPKTWYQEYRASNEVDTIDELEERFKSSQGNAESQKAVPESLRMKEVSIWKKTKFIFQPRVDQGLVIVGVRSPIAYVRAWVGVNGKTEVNFQQSFDSIGFRAMFNYEADTGKYFTSVDQRLMANIYLRGTSSKIPIENREDRTDRTLMLLYAKQF